MFKILFFLILTIQFFGCEEFTGYDYEAESIGDKSRLHGTVVNTFDPEKPVINAILQIGYLTTYTDSSGRFDVEYILSTDENRNKPVELSVTAEDYLDLNTEFIIEIPEQNFDINLDYGAPIIEKIWIGAPEEIIHQVMVTDFQGIDNIESVTTVFYYTNMLDPELKTITVEMTFIETVPGSDISAYYMATALPNIDGFWFYNDRWIDFTVIDKDGFSDRRRKKYAGLISPDPLF